LDFLGQFAMVRKRGEREREGEREKKKERKRGREREKEIKEGEKDLPTSQQTALL
jgi:hypothetical protein